MKNPMLKQFLLWNLLLMIAVLVIRYFPYSGLLLSRNYADLRFNSFLRELELYWGATFLLILGIAIDVEDLRIFLKRLYTFSSSLRKSFRGLKSLRTLTETRQKRFIIINVAFLAFVLLARNVIPGNLLCSKEYSRISFDSASTDKSKSSPTEYFENHSALFTAVDISGSFLCHSFRHYPNLFQTGPSNTGIRAELADGLLGIVLGSNSQTGYSQITVASNLTLNQWHSFRILIDRDKRVITFFDGLQTNNLIAPDLNFVISDIVIGSGYAKQREFNGKIDNFKIHYELWKASSLADKMLRILQTLLKTTLGFTVLFLFSSRCADAMAFIPSMKLRFSQRVEIDKTILNPALPYWMGLLGVLSVVLVYNLFLFNRFFPLTEGWFSTYAELILKGKTPYKDFYLLLPPLYPLLLAAFMSLFGTNFLALRILGIGLILFLAGELYWVYSRWFPAFAACFATIISMIYYQSGVAHITYDFTQFVTVYGLLSVCLIIYYCAYVPPGRWPSRKYLLGLAAAGAIGACAFLTKQSNGLFICFFCGIALLLGCYPRGVGYTLRSAGIFLTGLVLPIFVISGWLSYHGAFHDCIDQVYFSAVQSKGSLDSILWGWIKNVFTKEYFSNLIILSLGLLILFVASRISVAMGKERARNSLYGTKKNLAWISLTVLMSLLAVCLPYYGTPYLSAITKWGQGFSTYVVVISTVGVFLAFLTQILLFAMRKNGVNIGILILTTASLGFMAGNATSAGIGEISCFLGLGLTLCWLMSFRTDLYFGKTIILLLGCSYMIFLVSNKFQTPYYWWSVVQPNIHSGRTTVSNASFSGFRLSEDTGQIFEEVTADIQRYTAPNDSILAFPNIPVFYFLADRWPHSKVIVQWFDFLSDQKATSEAQRILIAPPSMIISLELPEFVWAAHEQLFRHGKRMGQRDIHDAISQLTSDTGRYSLIHSYPVPENCVLKVWRAIPNHQVQAP